MKTKEELCALKEEVEAINRKLAELTEEELAQVVGGVVVNPKNNDRNFILGGSGFGGINDPSDAYDFR